MKLSCFCNKFCYETFWLYLIRLGHINDVVNKIIEIKIYNCMKIQKFPMVTTQLTRLVSPMRLACVWLYKNDRNIKY